MQSDAHTPHPPCPWQAQCYLRIARKQRETTELHNLFVTGEKKIISMVIVEEQNTVFEDQRWQILYST